MTSNKTVYGWRQIFPSNVSLSFGQLKRGRPTPLLYDYPQLSLFTSLIGLHSSTPISPLYTRHPPISSPPSKNQQFIPTAPRLPPRPAFLVPCPLSPFPLSPQKNRFYNPSPFPPFSFPLRFPSNKRKTSPLPQKKKRFYP